MYQMEIKDLKKLRKNLPKGSIGKIAEMLGVSNATVSSVLSGKRNNSDVINIAIEIAEERKRTVDKIVDRINTL